jgi:hypothetical protein
MAPRQAKATPSRSHGTTNSFHFDVKFEVDCKGEKEVDSEAGC